MQKRVILIHGWAGRNNQDWFPWAIAEFSKKNYEVIAPAMPTPDDPKMDVWLQTMHSEIGPLRPTDVLVGHSMGAQTILRYLERRSESVDKVILVAGWVMLSPAAFDIPHDHEIAAPWIQTPIGWASVKKLANHFYALFSDNDPWVPLEENRKVFEKELHAQIIVLHDSGHFMKTIGNCTSLPILFDFV